MKILGIHDGHLATASLLVDGRLVAAVSEERVTGRKGQGGPPAQAIGRVLALGGVAPDELDAIALASLTEPLAEWADEQRQLRRRLLVRASAILPGAVLGSPVLRGPYVAIFRHKRNWPALERALAANGIGTGSSGARFPERLEHHACHAATAYYLAPYRRTEPMLVVTMDASGDGLCATVSIGRDGVIERLQAVPSFHSLGELYTRVTELLGMKPLEHEYKVMGLAPYAPAALADRAFEVFDAWYRPTADGLGFRNATGEWGPRLRRYVARRVEGLRFDAIAAGVQRLLEERVTAFVRSWLRRTGIGTLGLAGGVFMNVKLNMLIGDLPEVDRLFIVPSCGDETIGIGASLLVHAARRRAAGEADGIAPLEHVYLGSAFGRDDILAALERHRDAVCWEEVDDIDGRVARLLADGQIVGRLAGRMELGARSLGNRAILADPRDLRTVGRLNRAIKLRDFWMPFAPSILEERAADYLENPKGFPAPFMMHAFRTTARAVQDLPAALHPSDHTCRPHIVSEPMNPRYHRLIREFERLTGVGAVLNTSFNLHGEPMVSGPVEAIDTLRRSGLDAVAIEQFLVRRRVCN